MKSFANKLHDRKGQDSDKYANFMRTLSIKRDEKGTSKKSNIEVLQTIDKLKLYDGLSIHDEELDQSTAQKIDQPTNEDQQPQPAAAAAKKPQAQNKEDERLINIASYLNDLVNFNDYDLAQNTNLVDLIFNTLHCLKFNLSRNSKQISEFDSLLRNAQAITSSADNHQNSDDSSALKSSTDNKIDKRTATPDTRAPSKSSDSGTAEKEKKGLLGSFRRSRSLKPKNAPTEPVPLPPSEELLQYQAIESQLKTLLSQSASQGSQVAQIAGNRALIDKDYMSFRMNFNELERSFANVRLCLDSLNKFLNNFHLNSGTSSQLKCFLEYFSASADNAQLYGKLGESLNVIHSLLTLNEKRASGTENDLDDDFDAYLLAPLTNNSNKNFLLHYYKSVSYDFITFKLFTRQLQLVQVSAIFCLLVKKIIEFNSQYLNEGGSARANKNCFVFPMDKYKAISASNSHITLYSTGKSAVPYTNTLGTQRASTAAYSLSKLDGIRGDSLKIPMTSRVVPQINEPPSNADIFQNLFANELHLLLNDTYRRLDSQASVVNNLGYFYIVNRANGMVLEAVDLLNQPSEGEQQQQQEAQLTAKPSFKRSSVKTKGPRFFLQAKEDSKNEQLWYYYLYNGCIANKVVRSTYCMVLSGLNANSAVCLWPNVATTNCKWFINMSDNTIYSGLNKSLVLDFNYDAITKRNAVVANNKVENKLSQKWDIQFI